MAEQAPEHKDRGLFGLFGKKKEGQGTHDEHIEQMTHNQSQQAEPYYPSAPQHGHNIHNQAQAQAQAQAAPYYPTQPPHAEHGQVRLPGYEGQYFSAGEGEKQQHSTGVPGKFHRKDGSGSSSSSDEEEGGQKKKGGRKKKGGNVKHSGEHHSSYSS